MKRLLGLLFGACLLASACGEDAQLFYTAENETNFLASCVDTAIPEPLALDADADVRAARQGTERLRTLQNRICQCTIDGLEQKVPYQRFTEFDTELRADLSLALQPAVEAELVSCIQKEGSL